MSAALRAAEAHLGDRTLRLASATTIFASPMHPGKCIADVHVIRHGGSTAQVRVILRHTQEKNGEPGLELMVTEALRREIEERLRQARDSSGSPAPAPRWGTREARLAEIERVRRQIEENAAKRARESGGKDVPE